MSFSSLFFKEPKKDEFIPLVPTTNEYTSPNSDLLRQAIEDSLMVKATALANAKAALNEAFAAHTPPTHSLNEIDSGVAKAIEDVKPQIGYPGYVKPTLPPVQTPVKEPERILRWGIPLPSQQFIKDLVESDVGEDKEKEDYDDVGKDIIDVIVDRNTYSNPISGHPGPTYYKPMPVDDISERFKKLADSSGAFQRSLKPNHNTNGYDFIVAIGNPHNNRLILNCIENSRKELIHFKDNKDVIQEAIDRFNVDYDPQSMMKIVSAGRDDRNYMNIRLQFDTLDFDGLEIRAHFSRHEVVACSGSVDYIKCIKETIYFYLEGDLYLNENETKIESMEITGLNYANPSRNIISEKFVCLH